MINSTSINVLKVLATALVYFCHSWIVCYETYNYKIHGIYQLFITPAWAGVWIFLVVGGYLAAHGFYSGKYSLHDNLGGVFNYYRNRIVKILIPTWVFISLGYILFYQNESVSESEIIRWLTCTFNGNGSLNGIGASWYVFIVMWLYFISPFIVKIMNVLEYIFCGKEIRLYIILMVTIILLGGSYRVMTFFYLDWYDWTYANVLGCADLFIAGMLTYRMTCFLSKMRDVYIIIYRAVSIIVLVALIVICANFGGLIPYGTLLYRYVWPSGYLLVTCTILVLFSYRTKVHLPSILSLIAKFINKMAPYSFTFYLWHSMMLTYVVSKLIFVGGNARFLLTILMGFVFSSYIAFLMMKMNNGIIKTLSNK